MLCLFNRLKKILFLFLIIISTGCEAEYNIEINNNINLKETITIKEENKEIFNKKNTLLYNLTPNEYSKTNLKWPTSVYKDDEVNPYEPIRLDNTKYYTKTNISNYKTLGVIYSFNHNQNKYNETAIINKCYDFKYNKINDVITFETISSFKCFDEYKLLDKLTINVDTTCKVNIENSDKKENNRYTWYITKDKYDKKIKFEIDCKNNSKKDINSNNIVIILIACYLSLILLIIVIAKLLQEKNNKI